METIQKTTLSGLPQILVYRFEVPAGNIHFEGNTTKFESEKGPAVIWLARDMTRRKQAEENINRLVKFDPLTSIIGPIRLDRSRISILGYGGGHPAVL